MNYKCKTKFVKQYSYHEMFLDLDLHLSLGA